MDQNKGLLPVLYSTAFEVDKDKVVDLYREKLCLNNFYSKQALLLPRRSCIALNDDV